jgi:hypothetical protein
VIFIKRTFNYLLSKKQKWLEIIVQVLTDKYILDSKKLILKHNLTKIKSSMKQTFSYIFFISLLFIGCSQNDENKTDKKTLASENTQETGSEKLKEQSSDEEGDEQTLTVDERVEQIRGWYGEIQKIGMNNCITKRKTRYEQGFSSEGEEFPFEQIVKTCNLNDDFELIRGDFSGYEWNQQVSMYKRKGKIFFIFVTGGAEAWSYEYRYYFDKDENLIRHLEREADGGDEVSGPNKEKKIDPKKKFVKVCAKDYFKEIEFVLGRKE